MFNIQLCTYQAQDGRMKLKWAQHRKSAMIDTHYIELQKNQCHRGKALKVLKHLPTIPV